MKIGDPHTRTGDLSYTFKAKTTGANDTSSGTAIYAYSYNFLAKCRRVYPVTSTAVTVAVGL
jgi:hypothetical protein